MAAVEDSISKIDIRKAEAFKQSDLDKINTLVAKAWDTEDSMNSSQPRCASGLSPHQY